jgi:hypothetical protein
MICPREIVGCSLTRAPGIGKLLRSMAAARDVNWDAVYQTKLDEHGVIAPNDASGSVIGERDFFEAFPLWISHQVCVCRRAARLRVEPSSLTSHTDVPLSLLHRFEPWTSARSTPATPSTTRTRRT